VDKPVHLTRSFFHNFTLDLHLFHFTLLNVILDLLISVNKRFNSPYDVAVLFRKAINHLVGLFLNDYVKFRLLLCFLHSIVPLFALQFH